jgi:hypothetical protein
MEAAEGVLLVLATYFSIGVIAGLAFVVVGVDTIDPGAKGANWMFRLLILPGAVAFWPLVSWRWIQAGKGRLS